MANWQNLTADLEAKVVCVFCWMPQAIMNVKHSGKDKGSLQKSDLFGVQEAYAHVEAAAPYFETVKTMELLSVDLQDIINEIVGSCEPVFALFGSAAGSKFLHFSSARLFPVWDSTLRKEARLSDSPQGYFQYMELFQRELRNPLNLSHALKEYPGNPVRGWDIHRMRYRGQEHEED